MSWVQDTTIFFQSTAVPCLLYQIHHTKRKEKLSEGRQTLQRQRKSKVIWLTQSHSPPSEWAGRCRPGWWTLGRRWCPATRWPGPSETPAWRPCWTTGSVHGAGLQSGTRVESKRKVINKKYPWDNKIFFSLCIHNDQCSYILIRTFCKLTGEVVKRRIDPFLMSLRFCGDPPR